MLEAIIASLPFLLFPAVFVGIWVHHFRKIARLKAMNFSWYQQQHPDCVNPKNGRVKCKNCGGAHVGTERLMGRTFLRRHFCRNCGSTLYYSPEN